MNDKERIEKYRIVQNNLLKEIERLNNIIENLTTMTVNGDRTQIKNTAQYKIDRAIEYIENELSYGEHSEIDNILKILKGDDKE